jgi:hypothetical protein
VADLWLTQRELADHLRVSRRTVQRLDLPCLTVGGQKRYTLTEIYEALRGPEQKARVIPLRRKEEET